MLDSLLTSSADFSQLFFFSARRSRECWRMAVALGPGNAAALVPYVGGSVPGPVAHVWGPLLWPAFLVSRVRPRRVDPLKSGRDHRNGMPFWSSQLLDPSRTRRRAVPDPREGLALFRRVSGGFPAGFISVRSNSPVRVPGEPIGATHVRHSEQATLFAVVYKRMTVPGTVAHSIRMCLKSSLMSSIVAKRKSV
jgi:hypothetical protein